MGKFIDLTGMVFGRLTVLYQSGKHPKRGMMWHCRCSCKDKTEVDVPGHQLRNGNTQSCGCWAREIASERFKNLTKEFRATNNKKHKTITNRVNLTDYTYGVLYTTKGEEILFDKEDYEKIKNVCWGKNKGGYAYGSLRDDPQHKSVFMHRIVIDCPKGLFVDHINGIKTDNRKENLRIVTMAQNEMNKGTRKDSSSGCKGVTWNKKSKKWLARISVDKVRYCLGYFDKFEDAVQARREAEKKYYGEYAYNYEEMNQGETGV